MPGPKPKVLLQDWIPVNLEQARSLYALLVDRGGLSRMAARMFLGRLLTLDVDLDLTESERVDRAKLRRVLATLGEPPWPVDGDDRGGELRPLSSVGRAQPW